jgi:uncharacterized protein YidB (DUF937 family)
MVITSLPEALRRRCRGNLDKMTARDLGGQVQQIAEKLGVSPDEASSGLAEMLPQIVDKLSPEGSLPSEDLLHQGLGMIADKLFGK